MKIKVNSFCGVSRNPTWHSFLGRISQPLLDDLQSFLRTNRGCGSAKTKMVEVYRKIYELGKGAEFENFIQQHFPYMIDQDQMPQVQAQPQAPGKSCSKPVRHRIPEQKENINKHGVFKHYQPSILTFPHKLILVDNNASKLMKSVEQFLADKIKIDYIIVEDRAYVEYLLPKYANIQSKMSPDMLEISNYRLRKMQ